MVNFVQHVKVTRGPLASVYYCPFCEAPDSRATVKHQRPGNGVGRGFGFAASSKARAAVVAHIKAKHPGEPFMASGPNLKINRPPGV